MWNNISLKGNRLVFQPNDESNQLYQILYKDIIQNDLNNISILDMGCGSGAIGLALLKNLNKNIFLTGVDITDSAIKYSQMNAENNNIINCNFIKSDIYENLNNTEKFDIIFSSVPFFNYEYCVLEDSFKDIRNLKKFFTPLTSFCVGNDSNEDVLLEKVIKHGLNFLKNNGYLYLWIGSNEQKERMINLLNNLNYKNIEYLEEESGIFIKAQNNSF